MEWSAKYLPILVGFSGGMLLGYTLGVTITVMLLHRMIRRAIWDSLKPKLMPSAPPLKPEQVQKTFTSASESFGGRRWGDEKTFVEGRLIIKVLPAVRTDRPFGQIVDDSRITEVYLLTEGGPQPDVEQYFNRIRAQWRGRLYKDWTNLPPKIG